MGFRSTFITRDNGLRIPGWFYEKHKDDCYFGGVDGMPTTPISSMGEFKTYDEWWPEFLIDIQKVIREQSKNEPFVMSVDLVLLHDCGGVTKVTIEETNIFYGEPYEWEKCNTIKHDYCYGCSDINK